MAKMKKILLDTHIFLWIFIEPKRLPASIKSYLRDEPATQVYLSHVSSWEISIKYSAGKLKLPQPPDVFVRSRVEKADWLFLPIEHEHIFSVSSLPIIHKDPFDRLLISQAKFEGLTILSADSRFMDYEVDLLTFSEFN